MLSESNKANLTRLLKELTSYFIEQKAADELTFTNRIKDFKLVLNNLASGKTTLEGTKVLSEESKYGGLRKEFSDNVAPIAADERANLISFIDKILIAASSASSIQKSIIDTLREAIHVKGSGALVASSAASSSLIHTAASSAAAGSVKDNTSRLKREIKDLLKEVLGEIARQTTGEISIDPVEGSRHIIKLSITGDIACKYSVFASFRKFQPVGLSTNFTSADTDLTFYVDTSHLESLKTELASAKNLKRWLSGNGYDASIGSKAGSSALSRCSEYTRRNEAALLHKESISLNIGDEIAALGDKQIILPFSIHLQTHDDRLMAQLELYYKIAGLRDHLGLDKTFIAETRAAGMLHESNLAVSQCVPLLPAIHRLELFSRLSGIPCSRLSDEASITKVQAQIRGWELKQFETHLSASTTAAAAASSSTLLDVNPSEEISIHFARLPELSEAEFEEAMEKLLNKHFVLAPSAFRLFDGTEEAIHATAASALPATAASESSWALTPHHQYAAGAASSGRTPLTPAQVFLKLSTAYRESGDPRVPYIRCYMPHSDIRADKKIHDRLDELRGFLIANSPFFIVKSIVSSIIQELEKDSTTPTQIEMLLTSLGVPEADFKNYKMAGCHTYNTFQIKFSLLSLVSAKLINHGELYDLRKETPWNYNPHKDTKNHEHSSEGWLRGIFWLMNELWHVGWGEKRSEHHFSRQPSFFGDLRQTAGQGFSYEPPREGVYGG